MRVRTGSKLASGVSDTVVMVVQAPSNADLDLRCGGAPLVDAAERSTPASPVDPRFAGEVLLGKRYADDTTGVELLVIKGGNGILSVGGTPLVQKDAKKLPSSD
ncbi:hypothetical protein [Sciscionella marina]|uniref:hypothetical protein n=1 Tax=Sciscionella marina TaxID=508770 RepID=UPI000A054892|nr:hypothetical protein [Sciscionella marina]